MQKIRIADFQPLDHKQLLVVKQARERRLPLYLTSVRGGTAFVRVGQAGGTFKFPVEAVRVLTEHEQNGGI